MNEQIDRYATFMKRSRALHLESEREREKLRKELVMPEHLEGEIGEIIFLEEQGKLLTSVREETRTILEALENYNGLTESLRNPEIERQYTLWETALKHATLVNTHLLLHYEI